MFTSSESLSPELSVTSSENFKIVSELTSGASNVGFIAVTEESVTDAPETCDQRYETIVPSTSVLLEPSSVTVANSSTSWSGPAFAVGGMFTFLTVILTSSFPKSPESSVTFKLNSNSMSAESTLGATNVGFISL